MDRTISSAIKRELFGTTWKDQVSNLVKLKEKINNIKNIELYLPFLAYQTSKKLEFIYLNTKENIESYETTIRHHPETMSYYGVLFLREGHNKQTMGIELTTNASVVPQLVTRKHEYYYIWDKQQLTIRRMLGTLDSEQIEKFIIELLNEYKRFYFMYCK